MSITTIQSHRSGLWLVFLANGLPSTIVPGSVLVYSHIISMILWGHLTEIRVESLKPNSSISLRQLHEGGSCGIISLTEKHASLIGNCTPGTPKNLGVGTEKNKKWRPE